MRKRIEFQNIPVIMAEPERRKQIKFQDIPVIMAEPETLLDNFATLPDEIVLSILYETNDDSLRRICIANTRLYQLCQEPTLWKRLKMWNPIPPPEVYKVLPFTLKKKLIESIFPVGKVVYGYYVDLSRRAFIVTRHSAKSVYVRGVRRVYQNEEGIYTVKRPIQYWTPEKRGTVNYSLNPGQAQNPLYIRVSGYDLFPYEIPIHNYWVSDSFKAL